jgi:hypothetical protein
MSMVLSDVGAEALLKRAFKKLFPTGGDNLTLKLFCNNVNPADGDTAATYTEATGGGYAAKPLSMANFAVSTALGIAQAAYAQQIFAFTGPLTTNGTIYGWYLVDADGTLIYAQKSDSSVTPATSGDAVIVNPVFQLSKGTPS